MIEPKIKALFQFIEFLHSNIGYYQKFNDVINELELLINERRKVNPKSNFKDKLKYDQLQEQIIEKFKTLQDNVSSPIRAKAIELNVCNFTNEPSLSWNGAEAEISTLKSNFSNADLPEILKCKKQYIEYRSNTHKTFMSLEIFFEGLDKLLKGLFDYFKESEHNEFEAFETKEVQVNDINEAIKLQKEGHSSFNMPTDNFFNSSQHKKQVSTEPQPRNKLTIAQYLESIERILSCFGFNREPDKADVGNVTLHTKDFITGLREIYLSNKTEAEKANQYALIYDVIQKASFHIAKENFEPYPSQIWSGIILNLELANSHISELHFRETEQYYPLAKPVNPPQAPTPQSPDTLSSLITHSKSVEIVKGIKVQYKNIKGKRLKLLLLALQDLDLLPKERIAQKFYNCCEAEFDWNIASYNAMNGYVFNANTDSDDFDKMKQHIKLLKE